MKSYVVIGLGRFGTEMALKLYDCGEDVLAIDTDENIIDKLADRVTKAVAADARDLDVLENSAWRILTGPSSPWAAIWPLPP